MTTTTTSRRREAAGASSSSRSLGRSAGSSSASAGSGASSLGDRSKNPTLLAAAMQDHFMRSLNVQLPGGPRRRPAKKKEEPIRTLEDKAEGEALELTLAQKLGIVPAPPKRLTHQEWQEAAERSKGRQDSCGDCAICREPFRAEDQVLLSCSHTFHQACLASYERFSQTKACPLCRANDYEKRVIEDGRRLWAQRCACRLQSVWRGHEGRKIYRHVLETTVPTDPAKRKAFYERKVSGLTTRLVDAIDADRDSALDDLFAEAERAMAMSRAVFGGGGSLSVTPGNAESGAATGNGRGVGAYRSSDLWGGPSPADEADPGDRGGIDWEEKERMALERGDTDCPICLSDLGGPGRKKVLLSCTHIFHAACVDSFERFAAARGDGAPSCPCCRSGYKKKSY